MANVGPIFVQEAVEYFSTIKARAAATFLSTISVSGIITALAGIRPGVATNAYMTGMLSATASVGAAKLPVTANTIYQKDVTVTGCLVGDFVQVGISSSVAAFTPATNVLITGRVSTAGTVTVNVSNPTAVASEIATGAVISILVTQATK